MMTAPGPSFLFTKLKKIVFSFPSSHLPDFSTCGKFVSGAAQDGSAGEHLGANRGWFAIARQVGGTLKLGE
jgi:hypothetical protein